MVNTIKAKLFKLLLGLFMLLLFAIFAFYLALISGIWGDVPTKAKLRAIKNNLSSEIYSADGVLLGKYYFENRSNAAFDEIPQNIIDALVATEDVRFFEHEGIDNRSLVRVFVKTILLGDKDSGGGSTISQQLIKNLYPRLENAFLSVPISKFKEMVAARRLEEIYTKNEILSLYLNTVPFGDNTFGIKSAAEHYFSKQLSELSLVEAAVLVGMLKGTTLYNPYKNPKNALNRRNVVLTQMYKYGYVSNEDLDSLQQLPLLLNYQSFSQHSGLAPYFREHVRLKLLEWCKNNLNKDGEPYDLYRDGLKIYTTLDATLQENAEEAMQNHMARLQKAFSAHWRNSKPWDANPGILKHAYENAPRYKRLAQMGKTPNEIASSFKNSKANLPFLWQQDDAKNVSPYDSLIQSLLTLHTGVFAMNPTNGEVKVWIGGVNHKYFQYDHVLAKRQVGSTFKPFVYANALMRGVDPNDFYKNDSIVYADYDNWTPANSDSRYGGEYSVLGALVNSVNTVSVKLAMENGIENVVELAQECGIESELPMLPSIALGTAEIPLYEMVRAYAPFANGGYRVDPILISRIEDRNGNVLEQFEPQTKIRIFSENIALKMTHMLKMVVDSGTARSLRSTYGLHFDVAGKTGTTQSHADGWFIGFTPNLVTGVWTGADNPGVHFRTITYGQGAYMALPIYAGMAKLALKNGDKMAYFSSSFPMLNRRMSKQFECALYRDKAPAFNGLEKLFDLVEDMFVTEEKPIKTSKDSLTKEEGFFKRIGNLFRKKR